MKAPDFRYARPASVAEAVALLADHGDAARLLAGGQSLIPMMNFRLASPEILVDINRIEGLAGIEETADTLRVGALTRHAAVLASQAVARHVPLLAAAMAEVAHPAIRNRGTMGGTMALADPAAEMPACALALGATIHTEGPDGARAIAADDFFRDLYETALAAGEIIVAVSFPKQAGNRWFFDEITRRHGDYAMAGLAASRPDGSGIRLAFFGVAERAKRASGAERALGAGDLDAALAALETDLAVSGDLHADAAMKLHYARVLLGRAQRVLAP